MAKAQKNKNGKNRVSDADDFKQVEIQEQGDLLLKNVIQDIRDAYADIYISVIDEQTQKDRGIDFQIEIVEKIKSKTFDVFKIQNKGTLDPVKPLIKTSNIGLISFQLSVRHIRYYRQEMPVATMFTLCDISGKKVYWHPIQLDDAVDERADDAEENGQESIQIYIDPKNQLNPHNFKAFLDHVEESRRQQFFRAMDRANPITSGPLDFEVDPSKHLLDQVYDLIEYLYDEIRYLPPHLLIRNKPFKKADSYTPYYHWFKVITDNKELVQMFESITVNDDQSVSFKEPDLFKGVVDAESKAKTILTKLTQNHIYWLSTESSRKDTSTRLFLHQECDCVACRYYKLDFVGAIQALETNTPQNLMDSLKFAYMHYQLGNFKRAAALLEEIAVKAKEDKKTVIYMITQFNLWKLGKLIKNGYYDHEMQVYARKLQKIDLDRAMLSTTAKGHNLKVSLWIKNFLFFSEPAYDIQDNVNKLRDTYQGHIRGSQGSNRHFDELIGAFAGLHSFLNGNYLVYDKYGEYKQLVDALTEGIFASYTMHGEQGHMIDHLIDYHIHRLIFDGHFETTWRYFNKYHLHPIPYKSSDEDDGLYTIVKNLLANNHLVDIAFSQYSPEEGQFWRNKYPMLFANAICLTAIVEMDDTQAEEIVDWFIACLNLGPLYSPDCYVQFNAFLVSKYKQFSDATLIRLFIFNIGQKDQYTAKRFNVISNALKLRNITVPLTPAQQADLLQISFPDGDERSHNIDVYVYPVVSAEIQKTITDKIESKLDTKFDAYNYYYASIFELPLDAKYLTKFISIALPDPSKITVRHLFYGNEDNKFPLLDMLLNLCFKYKYDLRTITGLNFTGFADYYDWLLDIKNFDYSKFKINWLGTYATKFYFDEFRKYPVIKRKLEEYLKSKRDLRMERLYFDLYNPLNIESVEDE